MMLLVFRNTLRGHRFALLLMALGMAGLGLLLPTSFEAYGDTSSLMENIPEGFKALLKAEGNLLAETGARGYIAIGFRHPLFLIVLAAFAVGSASGAVAREIERKTILLLLSRPLSRYRLLFSRAAESSLGLLLLVAALLVGTYAGIFLAGLQDLVDVMPFIVMDVNALCLFLAIMGYSYLFSAGSSDWGKATMLSTVLTVAFFFLDFAASLFDFLAPAGYLSVFHYYDPVGIAIAGVFPVVDVVVLLGIATCTLAASVLLFQRRDIAA